MLIKGHSHAVANARSRAYRATFQPENWQGAVIDRLIKHHAILLTESLLRGCEAGRAEARRRSKRKEKSQLECLFLLRGLTWRRLREPETDGVFIHTCEEIRETTKRSCIRRKLIWIPVSFPFSSFFPRTFWKNFLEKENRRNNCLINCKYISYFPFCINALFFWIFAQIYLIYSVV